ncbi:Y-family DNA polymerase [Xanthomonas translucens]|uniref:Y-family DNA polymerase n=2 Tax=Xanthomonas campestris pv. translucens TaxID=343 RepID=UPI00071E8165|nr:DNA polymerase Y family protein [Xanthomonas translucens]AVY65667.1 DNA repair nucleotidyltransferase [Xanthomonas translucens pv. undulosa]WLA05612.1 DNA polymerase Y family protein [Xanthomonas translucens]WLA09421.1 DNA polymerase Y family protein [Xanthomonas translucens]WLA11539.1 DNA polymerase Y family protein [Xanthomonas translucens]
MRWACILLPQLALDTVLRRWPTPDQPLALLAGPPQRRTLKAVNPAARACGLQPGQSLATAQALCDRFATALHDAEESRRCQQFLAAWAYRFSSLVSTDYPGALLLEIEASLGLFGPWPRFEARLREELTALGFRHRIVVAPHPLAARALANAHDGIALLDNAALQCALGQLPIARAGLQPGLAEAFARMGLRTLQQLFALPRTALARRYPPALLQHLDALRGQAPLPLQYYLPPDRFDARLELGYAVESSQALLFPLRRLTADLAAFLAGRDGGVQRFQLHLEHEGLDDSVVPVGLLAAERDAAMLFELARGRLQHASVPAPVQAMRLRADELPPFVPAARELFDDRAQQALPWEQLRERLRARLGDDAVHGLRAHADHRPEQAWRAESGKPAASGKPNKAPAPAAATLPRPGWLLTRPIPLRERDPERLAGPERIESGWWDDGDVRRDYYIVRTRQGQRAWVFAPADAPDALMLHGWFA